MCEINGVNKEQLKESVRNASDKLVKNGFIDAINPESIESKRLLKKAIENEDK